MRKPQYERQCCCMLGILDGTPWLLFSNLASPNMLGRRTGGPSIVQKGNPDGDVSRATPIIGLQSRLHARWASSLEDRPGIIAEGCLPRFCVLAAHLLRLLARA